MRTSSARVLEGRAHLSSARREVVPGSSSREAKDRRALPFPARPIARGLLCSAALAATLRPHLLWACAACYGADSGPLAKGMNWGIFSLLGMIVLVLGGVATFFIYLAKKSAAVSALTTGTQSAGAGQPGASIRAGQELYAPPG